MAQNRAVVVLEPHKAGVVDVPYPTLPGDDWLIVRTTAVAINPTDWKHLDGENEWDATGCTIGFDYAGVVEEVGPAPEKSFKKGDRIAGVAHGTNYLRHSDGAFAKYIVVRSKVQLHTPANLSDEEAASLGVGIFTSAFSLYLFMDLPLPTQPAKEPFFLFINGGSTAMGILGIQYAKLSGATVITTSSPANADYLRSLGADYVLDYKSPSLADEVLALTKGQLKYAYDCHADAESGAVCGKVLSSEGSKFATLLDTTIEPLLAINPNVQYEFPLGYAGFGEPFKYPDVVEASPRHYEYASTFLELSQGLFEQGKVKPPRIFLNRGGSGLEGVLVGLAELKDGKVRGGKLVYTV